jgi:hypothetical protein
MRWIKAGWRWTLRGVLVLWIATIIAVVVAWVRSNSTDDYLQWRRTISGQWTFESAYGYLLSSKGSVGFHYTADRRPTDIFDRYYRQMAGSKVESNSTWSALPAGSMGMLRPTTTPAISSVMRDLGFAFHIESVNEPRYFRRDVEIGSPYWAIVLLILLPMPPVYRRWRKRRLLHQRERSGLCLRCGYDLRASSGVCPECGTPILAPVTGITT